MLELFACCRPSRAADGQDGGRPSEAEGSQPSTASREESILVPSANVEMLRVSKSDRILKPSCSGKGAAKAAIGRSSSVPAPRSLLEAAARRVEANDIQSAALEASGADRDDGGIPLKFIEAYMVAVRDADIKWASAPEVADMFDPEAKLVTQDHQAFHGKAAVLQRLEKGVATLAKMGGRDATPPEYEIAGPELTPAGAHRVRCTLRRGVNTMRFAQDFTIMRGKITLLQNNRL